MHTRLRTLGKLWFPRIKLGVNALFIYVLVFAVYGAERQSFAGKIGLAGEAAASSPRQPSGEWGLVGRGPDRFPALSSLPLSSFLCRTELHTSTWYNCKLRMKASTLVKGNCCYPQNLQQVALITEPSVSERFTKRTQLHCSEFHLLYGALIFSSTAYAMNINDPIVTFKFK